MIPIACASAVIRPLLLLGALLAAPAAAQPALWRIHDADTEIVLMGTMHELPADTGWLSPRIAAQVDAADTLVLEAIIPDDPSVIAGLVGRVGYAPGLAKLDKRVAPSRRTKLDAAVAGTRLSMDALDTMETWLATIVLSDAVMQRLGLTAANGVETILSARAKAAGKPVVALETLEQQFGYFDSMTETDQRRLLDATVDDIATARADTDQLVRAWLAGDTGTIAAAFRKDAMAATPAIERALMTDRNARWADWLKARLAMPGKVFVAVGAAHLAGPKSVQALLAARGVTVEAVP